MVVGGEIQIVKSVLPVCGVMTGAGGLVRKSMSRAHKPTDRHTHTHTETCCSTHPTHSQRFERKMTRSGAARNMGLMRHSRTAMRSAFHPHTGRHAHTSYRNLSRGSVSFFTVSTICRNLSFKHTQTCKHTHTHEHTSHPLLHPLQSLLDHPASVFHLLWRCVHL